MRSTKRPSPAHSPCEHESELGEELDRGREVVDHDADVLHPLESHVLDGKDPDSGRALPGAGRRDTAEGQLLSAA